MTDRDFVLVRTYLSGASSSRALAEVSFKRIESEIESLRSQLAGTIEKAAAYSLRVVELETENEKLRKNANRCLEMMDKINELRRENERLRDTLNRERNRSQS